MNGIYLTEEGKKRIEASIEKINKEEWSPYRDGQIDVYKEIRESATILPVEENWSIAKFYSHSTPNSIGKDYPNGLIIQPKID
jgi:hypothetical protein